MAEEEYNNFKNLDLTNQLWKIYQLLSERSKLVVTQEIGQIEKQYHEQDLKKCLIMTITPKSWLIFKNDLQMFLAFSNVSKIIFEGEEIEQEKVKVNYQYDFELKEDRKWVSKKWEGFKVVKNR